MGELKVVDVRCTDRAREKGDRTLRDYWPMMMPQLPSSVKPLRNLRTLCLEKCELENITIIGELLNLEILSIRDSRIVELPEEIGRLTKLILVDLRDCFALRRIAPGVISSLVQLQELYMRGSWKSKWEGEGKEEGRNASLREFESLSNLNTLEIQIRDAASCYSALFSKLTKYTISIECGISLLLKSTEYLFLKGEGSKDAMHELVREGVEGLQYLKYLSIRDCKTLECISNTMDWIPPSTNAPAVFLILESFYLFNLPNLREIFHSPLTAVSFGKLSFLEVSVCKKLRNLFRLSIARGLVQLRELRIQNCEMMEEIMWKEREEDGNVTNYKIEFPKLEKMKFGLLPRLTSFCRGIEEIEFPQLKELHLEHLPNLKCLFCNETYLPTNSEETHNAAFLSIFPQKVSFPCLELLELFHLDNLEGLGHDSLLVGSLCKLREINVFQCGKLLKVVPSQLLVRLRSLEKLTIKRCSSLEKVFELEGVDFKELDLEMSSPLKSLRLSELPKLNHKAKRDPIGFMYIPQLSSLDVLYCDSLTYLFSPTMTKSIQQLQNLDIFQCKMISRIVAEENGQGESSEEKIEFSRLKILRLSDMPNLLSFFSKVITTTSVAAPNDSLQSPVQPLLNNMVAFPSLEELKLDQLQGVNKIWCNQLLVGSFSKLIKLHVSYCGRLRNLFSPSTARDLVHLQNLSIGYCRMMEEVVSKEEEYEGEGRIDRTLVPKLKHLHLEDLPKLRSFCHVTRDWELPLLERITVLNCPEMKTFSPAVLRTPNLQRVFMTCEVMMEWAPYRKEAEWVWMGGLNETILHLHEKRSSKKNTVATTRKEEEEDDDGGNNYIDHKDEY